MIYVFFTNGERGYRRRPLMRYIERMGNVEEAGRSAKY
jgi:hypothetical protein